jgi:hypothetical protein
MMLDVIEAIPGDAEFFLAEVDTPVAAYGGMAYRFKLANVRPDAKPVEPGVMAGWSRITRYEFRARVALRESQRFIVNGVAIAIGGFAGTAGTAFDAAQLASRDVNDDEQLAIEQGGIEIDPSHERFVQVALHGDSRGGDGAFMPGQPF